MNCCACVAAHTHLWFCLCGTYTLIKNNLNTNRKFSRDAFAAVSETDERQPDAAVEGCECKLCYFLCRQENNDASERFANCRSHSVNMKRRCFYDNSEPPQD